MSYLERKIKESHTHVQSSSSATWVIQHDLNRLPVINVYAIVSGQEVNVQPLEVVATDLNSCTVTFGQAYSGIAEVF